jgi:membrane protease YdiL (CAAX protease family)
MHFAIFAIGLLWLLAARAGAASAAEGISRLIRADVIRPLLRESFLLLLLLTGYTALNWVASRQGSIQATHALPIRPTAFREWQKGAALGWGLLLIALLPMAVVGDLHPQFAVSSQAWVSTLVSVLALFVGTLATEIAYRGFLFRRLTDAFGTVAATILLSLLYAFVATSPLNNTAFSFTVAFIGGLLLSVCYLRTHALWLGWGLHFGWVASMGILFGLPLAGSSDLQSVVTTDSSGHIWLTGGSYGPEGAVFTILVLLAGLIALYPLTREYAWHYTQPPIVPAGYPMDVAPPPAHTAMEQASAPQLVQILGASSTPIGVAPPPLPRARVEPVAPPPASNEPGHSQE